MAFVADGYTFILHALDAPYNFLGDLQRVVEGAAQNAALIPGVAASVHGARYEQLLARLAWLDEQLCAMRTGPSLVRTTPLLQPSAASQSAVREAHGEAASSPSCSSAPAAASCPTAPSSSSRLGRHSRLRFRQDLRVLADMSHTLRVRGSVLSSALRSEESALLRWLDALCNRASHSTSVDERCRRLCAEQRRSWYPSWLPWSSRRAAREAARETSMTSCGALSEARGSRSTCESALCEAHTERDQARQLLHTALVDDFAQFFAQFKHHFIALCRQIVLTLQEWASLPPLPPRSRLLLSPPSCSPPAASLCMPSSRRQQQHASCDGRSVPDACDDATAGVTHASVATTSPTPDSERSRGAHWLLLMASPTVQNPLHARSPHTLSGGPRAAPPPPPADVSTAATAKEAAEVVIEVSSPLVLSNSPSDVVNAPRLAGALAESGTRAGSSTSSNVSSSLVSLVRTTPLYLPRNGDQNSTRRRVNDTNSSSTSTLTATVVHEPLRYYAFGRLQQSAKSVVQAYCLSLDYFLHLGRKAQADFPAAVVRDLREERARLAEAPVLRRYETSLDELLARIFRYRKRLELLQWQHNQLRFAEAKLAHHTQAGRRRKMAEWQARLAACRAELEASAQEMLMQDVEQLFALYDSLFDWAALYFSRLLNLLESGPGVRDARGDETA